MRTLKEINVIHVSLLFSVINYMTNTTTAAVYAFVNRHTHQVVYIGSTNNIMQRLQAHVDDCLVNDPGRDIYRYVREEVRDGLDGIDVCMVVSSVPEPRQYLHERMCYDHLSYEGSSGNPLVRLKNAKVPDCDHAVFPSEVECEAALEAVAHLISRAQSGARTWQDKLLTEHKRLLLEVRRKRNADELITRNKLLSQKNTDLNKRVKQQAEAMRIVEDMNQLLTSNVADLRGVLASGCGPPGTCISCTRLQEENGALKVRVAGLQAEVERLASTAPVDRGRVYCLSSNQSHVHHRTNDITEKNTNVTDHGAKSTMSRDKKQCEGCSAMITSTNIAKHKKRCKQFQKLPSTMMSYENIKKELEEHKIMIKTLENNVVCDQHK